MRELLEQGYTRVNLEFPLTVGSCNMTTIDEAEKAIAFNDQTIELDPDLQYVRFIMCHEGVNANGDYFTKEVLQRAQYTPRMKPVDWEHGQPIIGTMLDSRYAEDATGRGYIEAIGVVWKFIYPELAEEIKAKSASGELKLSMECYYRDATYKVGEQLYSQDQAEKMGVIKYVGGNYLGMPVQRVFTDVVFGGVGVVANPADKGAVFLAVARDLEAQEQTAATNMILRPVNDYNNRRVDNETNHAMVVAKYIKALDSAKSAIVGSFNNDMSPKTKEQLVVEVRKIVDGLNDEIASISTAYYKGTAGEEESNELEDIDMAKTTEANQEEILETEATEVEETEASAEEETTVVVADNSNDDEESEAGKKSKKNKDDETNTEDKDSKASELEARIVELEATIVEKDAAIASLQEQFSTVEAELKVFKSEKTVAFRLAELKDAGVEFSETRMAKEVAKLTAMDDTAFADYKELLVEVAGVKATASSETVEEVESVDASEDTEEEISVEGVTTASAGLVVEIQPKVGRIPFAHLTR